MTKKSTARAIVAAAATLCLIAKTVTATIAGGDGEWPPGQDAAMRAWIPSHWRIDFMARHPDAAERVLNTAWCRSELAALSRPQREEASTTMSPLPSIDDGGYDSTYCREADEAMFLAWALPIYYRPAKGTTNSSVGSSRASDRNEKQASKEDVR